MDKKQTLQEEVEVTTNTEVDTEFLANLFLHSAITDGQSLKALAAIGGGGTLAKRLSTDLRKGLPDLEAIQRNKEHFGRNDPVQVPLTGLCTLVWECLSDTMLQILLVAALTATAVGVLQDGW